MDGARYRATRDAFERIAEGERSQREAAVQAITDSSLRRGVQLLLDADDANVDLGPRMLDVGPPQAVGDYRILSVLGRGGMGVVYEAEQESPRRRVALKVLHPWLRTEAIRALVRREAQCLADVDHPGIPRVITQFDADGPVVVMELIEGLRADAFVHGLGWRDRVALLARICDAVAAVHRAGIVHRDLKPSNIVVRPDAQPVILDFGIAAHPEGSAPERSGTPAFMAPEQQGGPTTFHADLWALATIGQQWFAEGEAMAPSVRASAWPFSGSGVRMRPDLAAVLRKGRAQDPTARYTSAGAMADDLRRVLRDEAVEALPGVVPRLRVWLRRRLWTLLSTSVLLLSALALWTWRDDIDTALRSRRAAPRLEEIQHDPRGPADADVRRSFETFVRDPALVGTTTLHHAWQWARDVGATEHGLDAAAAAWIFAPLESSNADAAALAAALIRADAPGVAASALGDVGDPEIDRVLAVARRDFDHSSLGPRLRSVLRALSVGRAATEEQVPHLDGIDVLPGGVVRWSDGEQRAEWTLPCEVSVVRSTAPLPLIAGCRLGVGGLYRLDGPLPVALEGQSPPEPLPIADLEIADLDGDGSAEVIAAVAGWQGHELRVLSGPPWRTLTRLRLSTWSIEVEGRRIFALGGPMPAHSAPRSHDPYVIELDLEGGELVVRRQVPAPSRWSELMRRDVDGDGRRETLLAVGGRDPGSLGLLLDDADAIVQVPGLAVLEGRDIDADGDTELRALVDGVPHWLGVHVGSTVLRPSAATGKDGGTAPGAADNPNRWEVMDAALSPALRRSWTRAMALHAADPGDEVGLREAAAWPLIDLVRAAAERGPVHGARASRAALDTLGEGRPGPFAVAALRALSSSLDADAREPLRSAFARAHHWDEPTVALGPSDTLTFVDPLPRWSTVGDVGSLRRLPLEGSVELDLLPGAPPALALPILVDGAAFCVEAEIDIVEMCWSAGLRVVVGEDVGAILWRVGGGPRAGHMLNLSVEHEPAAVHEPFTLGPRPIRFCVSTDPASASVQVGDGSPQISSIPGGVPTGPTWLRFQAPAVDGYDEQRRAVVRLSSVRLHGARFDRTRESDPPTALPPPGDTMRSPPSRLPPAGPALTADTLRSIAEGDPRALRLAVRDGSRIDRAIARELLGEVDADALLGLEDAQIARLLRRAPRHWLAPVLRLRPDDVATLWGSGWALAMHYNDPWLHDALLDPSLAGHANQGAAGVRLELARARALLADAQFTRADAALGALIPHSPEAALLLARLRLRQGRIEESQDAVRWWIRSHPHPSTARDRIDDDAELSAALPWVRSRRFEPDSRPIPAVPAR